MASWSRNGVSSRNSIIGRPATTANPVVPPTPMCSSHQTAVRRRERQDRRPSGVSSGSDTPSSVSAAVRHRTRTAGMKATEPEMTMKAASMTTVSMKPRAGFGRSRAA